MVLNMFTVMFLWSLSLSLALVSSSPIQNLESSCKNKSAFSVTIDGPVSPSTEFHLQGLKYLNILGTFLITPQYTASEKEYVRRIHQANHTIGLFLPEKSIYSSKRSVGIEFKNASKWLHEIIGVWPKFIRVPEPYKTKMVEEETEMLGLVHIHATLDFYALDCGRKITFDSKEFIKKRITLKKSPWDIIRLPSLCKDDFYFHAALNQEFLEEFHTPDFCMGIAPYKEFPLKKLKVEKVM